MSSRKKTLFEDMRSAVSNGTAEVDDLLADPITAQGVGLRASEWLEVARYAKEYNVTTHALAVKLLRYGMDALKSGKIGTKRQIVLDV